VKERHREKEKHEKKESNTSEIYTKCFEEKKRKNKKTYMRLK
jgi:hypothetical protein